MTEARLPVVAGFPEFWQQVYDTYPLFFAAAERLASLQNKILRKPVREALPKLLRRIAITVSNSFGAVITLALNGYGNDAMKIARGMFEAELTAAHLRNHPEGVQDYMDFQFVSEKRMLDYLKDFAPEMLSRIPSERVAEVEQRFEAVSPRFRGQNRWTKKTIREMAQDAGLIQPYLTVYSWASSMHHLDVIGLSTQVARETFDVDVAPSQEWLDLALLTGHGAVIHTLSHLDEAAGLGMDREIQAAVEEFKKAWQIPKASGLTGSV